MLEFIDTIRTSMYAFEKRREENIVDCTPEIEALLSEIELAFGDVGDEGTPYLALAGEASDGSYFPEMLCILSRHELRGDWREIPHCLLDACACCLSFVEPLGYRFLLPAYMRFSLLNNGAPDMVANLAASEDLLDYQLNYFSFFNERQLEAVNHFMHWHRQNDGVSLSLGWLLPWEMAAYLAQDEYSSPQDWILAHHEEMLLVNGE